MPNFDGVHGNAVLSACPLHSAEVFRDPTGIYFSSKSRRVNAYGFEKRLGGRMALLVSMTVNLSK